MIIVSLACLQSQHRFLLVHTEYYAYEHPESRKTHVACESYSLPEAVRNHVDFILPGVNFDIKTLPRAHSKRKRAELGSLTPLKKSNPHLGEQAQDLPNPDADSCATSVSIKSRGRRIKLRVMVKDHTFVPEKALRYQCQSTLHDPHQHSSQ